MMIPRLLRSARAGVPALLIGLGIASCDADRVFAPGAPDAPLRTEVNVEVGEVEVSATYGGVTPTPATTGCASLVLRLVHESGKEFSAHTGCWSGTARDLPVGEYTATLYYGGWWMGSPVVLGGPEQITVSAGQKTALSYEVGDQLGVVTGKVLINGEPANSNYNVCGVVDSRFSSCYGFPWSESDGVFRLLLPPGAGTGNVNSMSVGTLATFAFTATAGDITDIGEISTGTGEVEVSATYGGATPTPTTTGCASLVLRLVHESGKEFSAHTGCWSGTARDLPVGEYTATLYYGGWWMGSPVVLGGPEQITVSAGQKTALSYEVGEQLGVVTGKVLINGAPANSSYNVCGVVDSRFSSCYGFPWSESDGVFRLLLPPGAGTGNVNSMSVGTVATFAFTATGGEITDIGEISTGTGEVEVSATYGGVTPTPATTGCASLVLRLVHESGKEFSAHTGCWSGAARDLPVGEYTATLYYGGWWMGSPVVLGGPEQITVSAGQKTALSYEVGDQLGVVTGKVLINGEPANSNYNVCGVVDSRFSSCYGFPWSGSDGTFRLLLPPGPGIGNVNSMSVGTIATFTFNVNAGGKVDVGNPLNPGPVITLGGPYGVEARQPLALSWSATDPDAPITYEWDFGDGTAGSGATLPSSHTYTSAGSYTLRLKAVDSNGGETTATTTVTVTAPSNLPPTADAGADRTVALSGARTAEVTLDGSGSSDDGQLQPLSYTWALGGAAIATGSNPTVTLGLGTHVISLTVEDGDLTAADEVVITVIDPTPPAITSAKDGTLGDGGWHVSDVAVSWTVTDAESDLTASGCDGASVTEDTTGASFTCEATSAGGTSSESVSVKRDATTPLITFAGNMASYTVDQRVSITCSATDALSGIAAATCPEVNADAYTLTLGTHTLNASAADVAGNTSAESVAFEVQATHGSVCALVERFVSQKGIANSLCAKLRNAESAEQRGQANAAANLIDAFVNEVEAQAGKAIGLAEAEILITLARAL